MGGCTGRIVFGDPHDAIQLHAQLPGPCSMPRLTPGSRHNVSRQGPRAHRHSDLSLPIREEGGQLLSPCTEPGPHQSLPMCFCLFNAHSNSGGAEHCQQPPLTDKRQSPNGRGSQRKRQSQDSSLGQLGSKHHGPGEGQCWAAAPILSDFLQFLGEASVTCSEYRNRADLGASREGQGQPVPEHPGVSSSFPTPAPSSFWHQQAENMTADEVMCMDYEENDLSNNLGC